MGRRHCLEIVTNEKVRVLSFDEMGECIKCKEALEECLKLAGVPVFGANEPENAMKPMSSSGGTFYAKTSMVLESGPNKVKSSKPHNQKKEPICWAFAISTAIRAAEWQIKDRKLQSHDEMVDYLVATYKINGKRPKTIEICRMECEKRKLRCQIVEEDAVVKVVLDEQRVVIVSFGMDKDQWKKFSKFYKNDKKGVF